MSARAFLLRGLLAGLIAGIAAFAVAYVVGEPSLDAAIALEQSSVDGPSDSYGPEAAAGPSHEDESTAPGDVSVPRSLQSTAGLLTGMLVAGVTLGGLAAVVSAIALGRFGRLGPRATTLAVAAIGFVVVYAVPFSMYPPNPPAVGSGDTIAIRSALYFVLLAISLVAAVTAVLVGRRLADRLGGWHAALAAIGGYLLVTVVVITLLPTYDEVPGSFPASVLYEFRAASLLTQLTLWTVLGVTLAELVGRLSRRTSAPDDRELADVAG